MRLRNRSLITAGGLALATLVLVSTGLLRNPLLRLALINPWRHAGANDAQEARTREVTALREQVVQLNSENVILRTRLNDYLSIRGEGGFPPEQVVVVRARIIARTQRSGRRYLELDSGAVDGVAKGMVVCCGWSLIGLVAGVQEGSCLVQEVTDSECRVPALLLDGQKIIAEGVVAGNGKRNQVLLDFVEDRAGITVAAGQLVVTSHADTKFPAGLVIGTVTKADHASTADHWHIEVTPLRIGESCESLLVLKFATQTR
jgi:rod shape-determining protein MreC